MRLLLAIVSLGAFVACELQITNPAPVIATTSPGGTTITNTNTNTATNTDGNDAAPLPGPGAPDGNGTGTGAAPLPAYGESVTRGVAATYPALLANSCQVTSGESAWGFLDQVIRTLRGYANDSRWGYLCKDASCSVFARDIVAYRATSADTGIFIVDVIGNHCPGPTDPAPSVWWGVLPFETARRWSATR